MSEDARQSRHSQAAALEPPDVATKVIVLTMAALAAFVALSLGGAWLFYARHKPGVPLPRPFASPRLQTTNGSDDLVRLRAAQREKISSYAWIDRERGLIRIPIERAMGLIAARGAGGYDPIDAAASKASPP